MKTLTRLIIALALITLTASAASAQRVLTTTTITADQSATATTMTVSSSTGFVVGQVIWIGSEVELIRSLNGVAGTSTQITVTRGIEGVQAAHDNTNRIIVSGSRTDFQHSDPDYQQDCTRGSGQAAVLPWINVLTATVWSCPTGSRWLGTRAQNITFNSVPTSF